MATPDDKTPLLGVLGGMGPLATHDFLGKILAATPPLPEAEQIPMRIEWRPDTPDRRGFLKGQGPDPLPFMQAAIGRLVSKDAPASLIVMPVVTVHHWHAELQSVSAAPILHVAEAVCAEMKNRNARGPVGIVGTWVTLERGIFDPVLQDAGYELVKPGAGELTSLVMPSILAVKEGRLKEGADLLFKALVKLRDRGAKTIILGCTEFPVVMREPRWRGLDMIDATEALAIHAVRRIVAQRRSLSA